MRSFVLLLPPACEATFFPYLSLPSLTAALRDSGADVQQIDLNLRFIKILTEPIYLRLLRKWVSTNIQPGLKREVRFALLDEAGSDGLAEKATDKGADSVGQQLASSKLLKRLLDLILEASVLGMVTPDIGKADVAITSWLENPSGSSDVGLRVLDRLLKDVFTGASDDAIFGLSIPFYSQLVPSLACSAAIRKRFPAAMIVWGGPQVWLHFNTIRRLPRIRDWVNGFCFGQGEHTVCELIHVPVLPKAEMGGFRPTITNFRWIDDDQAAPSFGQQEFVPINDLSAPDYSDYDLDEYIVSQRQASLITCYGCYWGRCAFCSYGNRYHATSSYQELTPSRLADHCEKLMQRDKVYYFVFADENNNLKQIAKACRLLQSRGYKFQFNTRNRLEKCLLNIDFCFELRELGCDLMSVGYETNSQRLLDRLDRGVNSENFQEIIDNLNRAHIPLRVSVMGSILDETMEELKASVAFIERNSGKMEIDTSQTLIVEPNTYLALNAKSYGISLEASPTSDWNRLGSFGLGRVGFAYQNILKKKEIDSPTFFRAFSSPSLLPAAENRSFLSNSNDRTNAVKLQDGIVAIKNPEDSSYMLCDLANQRFWKLDCQEIEWETGKLARAKNSKGSHIIDDMVVRSMARYVG